jgi:acetyltransferase-like isoleucine patch superfamily enzyme
MKIGLRSHLDDSIKISSGVDIEIGDCSYVGPGVRISGSGRIRIGDYCKIHTGCFMNLDGGSIEIGHNSWFGERSVIDGRGTLSIGNNVGVGIASQLYSHIAHGDTIEGCNLYGNKSLVLEDDVWLVGQCFMSPVHARKKSVAMLGSVIIKDMDENRIYSGNPAVDVTQKIGHPWVQRTNQEKLEILRDRIRAFSEIYPQRAPDAFELLVPCDGLPDDLRSEKTYIDISTRKYTKRLSDIEMTFFSWLTSYKGRFTPL